MGGADDAEIKPKMRPYNTYVSLSEMINSNKKIKFGFAHDNTYTKNGETHENKKYFHFPLYKDVVKLLETDSHIYEILLTKRRKLYYDFDNIDYTKEEADEFIAKFIGILELELNILIDRADVIVLCNEPKTKSGEITEMIQSLHVIIPSFKMEADNQYKLAQFINAKYSVDIDENCYKSNQIFRMINQSKLKYGVRLINYNTGNVDIKKSLICQTDKSRLLKFNKTYNIIEYYNDLPDEKPLYQISKENIFNYMLSGGGDKPIFDRTAFFNDNQDWKTVTMILIKKPMLCDISEWKKKSVTIADNPEYTEERNDIFCDKIVGVDVKSGLTKLYKIASKYSNYNLYSTNASVKSATITLLQKYYTDDIIRDITEEIVNEKTMKVLDINGKPRDKPKLLFKFKTKTDTESIINIKTGFTVFQNNQSPINIFYDELPPANEKMFQDVENIIEAKDKTTEFINGNKKIMVLKSKWGTGKTSNIINYLLEQYKSHSILIVTESNTLNNKLTKDFEKYEFVSHLDAQQNTAIKLCNYDKVICSIQSIAKISSKIFDLVIIDEFESVFTSYTSTKTFISARTTNERAFTTLINIIKRSDKTLVTDADISEDKVTMLENIFGRNDMMVIKNKQLAFEGVKFKIMTDRETAISYLTQKLYDGNKKVAVASASKALVEGIVEAIRDMELASNGGKILKILTVIQEGVSIIQDGVETKYDKDTILKDVETFIINNNIDLFCYSPTIKTGVSINSSYFDTTIGFGSKYSILYNEFLQMIFRQRKLTDNEIVIYLKENDFNNKSTNKDAERIAIEQHWKKDFFNTLIKDSIVYGKTECSEEYYQVQTINNKNAYNSRYNYVRNLLQLIQYHQLDYEWHINNTYKECEQIISDYDICIEVALAQLKERKKQEWLGLELYAFKRYSQLALLDKQERYENLSELERKQYIKTNLVYGLFKIKAVANNHIKNITERTGSKELGKPQYEQLQVIIDEIVSGCDNPIFYTKYIERQRAENIFCIHSLFYEDNELSFTHTPEDDKAINKLCIEELFIMFDLYEVRTKIFTDRSVTNKQFKSLIIENIEFISKLYKSVVHNKESEFNVKNKQHIKIVYHAIKDKLSYVDVRVKYETNNTTRDCDKFIITNKRPKVNRTDWHVGDKTDGQFYKFISFIESDALAGLPDKSSPKTITIDTSDIYSVREIDKKLQKTRNTKKEYQKLQHSSLYHNRMYENAGVIKGVQTYIDSNKIQINNHFYNEALDMKTVNDKIVMNGNSYDIKPKNGDFCIVTDKRTQKTLTIYKYDTGRRSYYKPYKIDIPIIKTTENESYLFTHKTQYAEQKSNYEQTGEECCECEGEDFEVVMLGDVLMAEPKPFTEGIADFIPNNNIIEQLHPKEELMNEIQNSCIVHSLRGVKVGG